MEESRDPKGAGQVAYLTQQPPPVPGCVEVRSYTAPVRRAFFEAKVARTHTLLFLSRWVAPAPPLVAGSPVAFLVATPWWPPDRCAAGLDFS